MSQEITLPSGWVAKIRDPAGVKYGAREDLIEKLKTDANGNAVKDGHMANEFARGLVALGVIEWNVEATDDDGEPTGKVLPLPRNNPDSLREMSPADVQALIEGCKPLEEALFPDFDPSPDEKSPTTPSAG